jgi:hypothetical protein
MGQDAWPRPCRGKALPTDFEIVRAETDEGSPARSAFDYLMAHARAAAFVLVPRLSAVRSIELQYPHVRRNPFSAQARPRHLNFYLRGPILTAVPGLFAAAEAKWEPVPANSLDEYRRHLRNVDEVDEMLDFLRQHGAWPSKRTDRRFVAATFEPVQPTHLLDAAQRLAGGFTGHRFGRSTDYDLLFNGERLPPKAVFGLAATEALGFPVRPENFSAGESMPCFRILRAAGYEIVEKGDLGHGPPILLTDEDRAWAEGRQELVTHLKRERASGLAAAKRSQFRSRKGRLYCERCEMDPVEVFGSAVGEACIEVHHEATHVGDMDDGHQTRLDDLQCLCANCHRVRHRELKLAVAS